MRGRTKRGFGGAVRAASEWVVTKLEDLGVALVRLATSRRARPPRPRRPENADERTIRRVAEAQHGGISSAESDARYERGDNPGGTHQKAVRREEGSPHPRPEQEEPQERKERAPHGERHIPVTRRGS